MQKRMYVILRRQDKVYVWLLLITRDVQAMSGRGAANKPIFNRWLTGAVQRRL
jgi:hypothetical protein